MKIILNGVEEIIPDGLSITDLIEWVKEGDPHLMVEVNNTYIYPKEYDRVWVRENDRIEMINPNLGG
ncbi:MAG: hypothetical protein D3926_14405 [Desulfobacteraceae bacterium]|nr:MAG: hypothetical protein D3926_14405 [Desulfobacteraceae bacterium]